MAEMAFPLGRNEYITEKPVQMWLGTRSSGVYSADGNLRVTAGGGMKVSVLKGLCWLKFAEFRGVMYGSTDTVSFTLDPSDAFLKRIDRVVVRFDIVGNEVKLAVKKGEFNMYPEPPAIERVDGEVYELAIADVYIAAGADDITDANITDTRLDSDLCGLMRDGVDKIPSEGLLSQWREWFENLKEVATGGAEEMSEWIYEFKHGMDVWRGNYKLDADNWLEERQDAFDSDVEGWIKLFKSGTEKEVENWLKTVRQYVIDDNVASGFAVAIKELNDDVSYVGYDFDNPAAYAGCETEITFPDERTMLEIRKNTDTDTVTAKRMTVFLPDGGIKETTSVYKPNGGLLWERAVETTFNGDKITERVV